MRFELHSDGVEVVSSLADPAILDELDRALPAVEGAGVRGIVHRCEAAARWAKSDAVMFLMRSKLGNDARLVRSILFDKSPVASWTLGLHRDLSIAVAQRVEMLGFGPWSIKQGVNHVQPPRDLLEQMLTLRLHLDDANEDNGCLRIVPGSHLPDSETTISLSDSLPVIALRGDGVLMRPLVLHGSGANKSDRRRRVLHLEFAAFDLPQPLQWAEDATQ